MSHELNDTGPENIILVASKQAQSIGAGDLTWNNPPQLNKGGITTDGTLFNLPAGHTYVLLAHVRNTSAINSSEAWVDGANVPVGQITNVLNAGHSRTICAVVTGPATVKVRRISASGGSAYETTNWVDIRAII